MPSHSVKQKNFMRAAAHSPEFAAKAGIAQSVAREFYNADSRAALQSRAFANALRRNKR